METAEGQCNNGPQKSCLCLTCTTSESEKETELWAKPVKGIGENIMAMPQYFHLDVKMEPSNVIDWQEKGHLVVLSRSTWQVTLFLRPFFSQKSYFTAVMCPNLAGGFDIGQKDPPITNRKCHSACALSSFYY